MTKEQFIREVTTEIETIKLIVTTEEINKLDLRTFDEESEVNCIYGQMTGSCNSSRAQEIMPKSCYCVFSITDKKYKTMDLNLIEDGNLYTPLELYLFMVNSKVHEHIIQYLKSEIETLIISIPKK